MYLGVDIGGTKTLVACLNEHGVIVECIKFPTPQDYPVFLIELANTVAELSTKDFAACCVAVPGRLDRKKGIGLAFGNLPWKNVPICADAKKIVGCPTIIENDAKLAGLSEAMLVKHYTSVLYLTFSTGIGVGFITDREIDPDFDDMEGGQILLEHHGTLQKWEDFASGRAIVKRFGKRAEDIHDAKTWKLIAHDMALGIIDLIAIIQPQIIIFGGSVGLYFERFQPHLEAELRKYETPLTPIPELREAARPNEAVIYGCYDLAKSRHGSIR